VAGKKKILLTPDEPDKMIKELGTLKPQNLPGITSL
jgi:hypothetical protein